MTSTDTLVRIVSEEEAAIPQGLPVGTQIWRTERGGYHYVRPGGGNGDLLKPITNFEEFMDPAIQWIGNPEFDIEFERVLQEQQNKTKGTLMAAHTNVIDPVSGTPAPYPAFINIRFEGGRAIVTARGDPEVLGGDPLTVIEAPTVHLTLEQGDWDQFVSEATRERGLVPGG